MHLKKFVQRNFIEGSLVFAGTVILITQFAVAKYLLSDGGVDHTTIIGVPFDDTYIHARFAENLFHGNGFSFNPGHVVSADTSPLWVLMIAAGGFITSHFDLITIILSAIAWLLLAPGVYRIARYVFVWEKSFSIMAAISMLLAPRILAMALSGMETTFAMLLAIIAVTIHYRSREIREIRIREAIVLGLGMAVRPEFYLLGLICLCDWLYLIAKKQVKIKEIFSFILPLAFFACLVFSIPYNEGGSLLYHSSLVQGAGFRFPPDIYYIGRAVFIIFENFWWLFLFAVVAYFTSFRIPKFKASNAVLILFMILLPIVQGFVAPQYRHFGRYFFLIFPFVILSLAAIVRDNMRSGKNERKRIIGVALIAIVFSMPLAIKWTSIYAESVRNINDQHLAVTEWVQKNTTDKDKIAAHDVGALGYFTNRNIIDLTGLVSPEFFPLQADQSLVWKEARRQGANIFIIYQRLNPTFYQYAKDSLELIEDYRVRTPFISSADTVMSLFRAKGSADAAR